MRKIEVYDMTGRLNPGLSKNIFYRFSPKVFEETKHTKISESIYEFKNDNQTSRLDLDKKEITIFVNKKGIDRVSIEFDDVEIQIIKEILTNDK